MKMNQYKYVVMGVCLLFAIHGCSNNGVEDSPTTGKIFISVDETFQLVIDAEIETFQKLYPYAKIIPRYKPESEVIYDLLNDSSRIVIMPRLFNEPERDYFRKIEIVPRETKICIDAVTFIVNKENTDTLIDCNLLWDILGGRVSKWKQVNRISKFGKITIVYDNQNSSTLRLIKERLSGKLSDVSYATKSNKKVIEFVAENKNALGIIGVNWISDRDDTLSQTFLKTINVVGIKSNMPGSDSSEYYKPYQAYIALKYYPVTRDVYILSREARNGLGTGFSAFIAGDKGQRIILKSGLVPATKPVRLVQTYNDPL